MVILMQFDDIDAYIEHCKSDPLPVLPIPTVAEYIGISASGVTGRLQRGALEQIKIGKAKFVSVRSLLKVNEEFQQKVEVIKTELAKLAGEGVESIYYGEIMPVVGLNWQIPADRTEFGWILGTVSRRSFDETKTMLSVLVHRKKPGQTIPGPGFFPLAEDLGFEWDDELEFVVKHTKKVLRAYRK